MLLASPCAFLPSNVHLQYGRVEFAGSLAPSTPCRAHCIPCYAADVVKAGGVAVSPTAHSNPHNLWPPSATSGPRAIPSATQVQHRGAGA